MKQMRSKIRLFQIRICAIVERDYVKKRKKKKKKKKKIKIIDLLYVFKDFDLETKNICDSNDLRSLLISVTITLARQNYIVI